MQNAQIQEKCRKLRRRIINIIADAGSGHPGGSLSTVEILTCLYYAKMDVDPKNPQKEDRDRFILSKGHAAPAIYAVLADMGYFSESEFQNFRQLGSILQGHPDSKKVPGIEAATGSLGQGISIAAGMALGAKIKKSNAKVYTLLGDGELQEGQVWEACTAAAHFKLDNLTVIIDNNGLQIDGTNDEVMALGSLKAKFEAFGFYCLEIDGHDIAQIRGALDTEASGKPKCIIAKTVKGKGVSFMENQVGWHGKAPSNEERIAALKELEG